MLLVEFFWKAIKQLFNLKYLELVTAAFLAYSFEMDKLVLSFFIFLNVYIDGQASIVDIKLFN